MAELGRVNILAGPKFHFPCQIYDRAGPGSTKHVGRQTTNDCVWPCLGVNLIDSAAASTLTQVQPSVSMCTRASPTESSKTVGGTSRIVRARTTVTALFARSTTSTNAATTTGKSSSADRTLLKSSTTTFDIVRQIRVFVLLLITRFRIVPFDIGHATRLFALVLMTHLRLMCC
jgi:hypothetical protein